MYHWDLPRRSGQDHVEPALQCFCVRAVCGGGQLHNLHANNHEHIPETWWLNVNHGGWCDNIMTVSIWDFSILNFGLKGLNVSCETPTNPSRGYWRAGCWRGAAFLPFHWPCCSWGRGFSLQPSPWMRSWPSRPRCVSGCWASPEPQRTPPEKQNQRAGKQSAKCR